MNQNPGIFGKKVGFTQIFTDDGNVRRVTVIQTGPVTVVGKRTKEKDGYVALVLGLVDAKDKHVNKAEAGIFKKAGVTAKRIVKELRCSEEFAGKFEVGGVMKLDQIFEAGQKVDTQGTTKGRGFTGVMRRWNFAGAGSDTHGTHEYRRHGGSIGTNMTPGRTLPNVKMGGHYGDETVSMLNLQIVKLDVEKNLLMIDGGVPGAKNSLVLVRHAVKTRKRKAGR
jgi:large subunit ribosomal protein L3